MSSYYRATVEEFLATDSGIVLGELARQHTGSTPELHSSWQQQIRILKAACDNLISIDSSVKSWGLLIEYRMFRLHRRIDTVLIADKAILVIEFKVGARHYDAAGLTQVEDYALDLRDFHAGSKEKFIIPILCATQASPSNNSYLQFTDNVSNTLKANSDKLAECVLWAINDCTQLSGQPVCVEEWDKAAYAPVPNIIEAAELLYAAHDVKEIHSALAEQKNLTTTTDKLIDIIAKAQQQKKNAICFITGVPGSGKTLVGLNAIHDPRFRSDDRPSGAFLSGNTPLVAVLREVLARDEAKRIGCRKSEALRRSKAQIQLLMRYLDQYLRAEKDNAPHEHVIVFDEAQRAWDAAYGKQKFDREASEPSLFLEIMSRHSDWAVIVALVGGGQEINKGEGGLAEWGDSLIECNKGYPMNKEWRIYASPHVLEGSSVTAGGVMFPNGVPEDMPVTKEEALHLPVSIRSHRCEVANAWVDAVLEGESNRAAELACSIGQFPIYMTRSLKIMKGWLNETTRGSRRCGLVASSDARRLRAYGLGVTLSTQDLPGITNWFLSDRGDVRSSYQLEVTATEYACQGLELDRVGLCWGGDMTWSNSDKMWQYRKFRGNCWQNVSQKSAKLNVKNTYRVLMSRAREALVIWVPRGCSEDKTRPIESMDETAVFLKDCGVFELAET